MAQLAPIQPPLGPQPPSAKLYTPNQATLVLKEKIFSISQNDYTIKTTEGLNVCKCKGKVFSVHDKKKFTDMQDVEIFTLANKLLSIPRSFRGESPGGQFDFEIKGHIKIIGSKSTVLFKNAADGQNIELDVKGKWLERTAEITWQGRPVAQITRQFFNARQLWGDDTYFVSVAGNVDLSLIAAICVALDEREHDK